MDACLAYLMKAEEIMESYQERDLVDFIFEEEEGDNAEVDKENEAVSAGATNALARAFKAIKDAILRLIARVKEFIDQKMLKGDEKERFEKFKAEVKSDPDLAGTKVTIASFREYEKAYDQAMKELEAAAKQENAEMSKLEETGNKVLEKLKTTFSSVGDEAKGIGKRAAMVITMSTAIDIAERDKLSAKALNAALKNELVSLEEVEKELGQKDVVKFKKKIDKLSRAGWLHRMKVKILYRKEATLEAVLKKQLNTLLSYTNIKDGKIDPDKPIISGGSIAKGSLKHPKLTVKTLGGPDKVAKAAANVAKIGVGSSVAHRKFKKAKKKTAGDIGRFSKFVGIKKPETEVD